MQNIVKISLVGLAAFIGYNIFNKYSTLAKNVEFATQKMPQIDATLTGLRIRYYGVIKNPTRKSMNLQIPQVTLLDGKGNFLTQSTKIDNTKYQILPLSTTPLNTQEFLLSWSTLAKIASNFNRPQIATSYMETILDLGTKILQFENIFKEIGLTAKVQMYIDNTFTTQNFPLYS